jgi:hypothetical protein
VVRNDGFTSGAAVVPPSALGIRGAEGHGKT